MKKDSLKINLDNDQVEWLRQQAKLIRCSLSQMIRILIAEAQQRKEKLG
jgi:hypothetical protein